MSRYTGLVEHYRSRLPLTPDTRAISLGEGRTPLIKLDRVAKTAGFEGELYVKFEGLNPTGSFKDRGMTVAVTQAVREGAKAIICASTGNTSAAAAAYAARAGITAFVLIPEGKIALGKLAQAIVHGAVVVQIRGNFDDGMRLVKEVAETAPVAIVNSINPYRLQGQKTAAFEIVEALGRAPDYHCIPVGNAGNISAHWLGYSEVSGFATTINRLPAELQHYARDTLTDTRPKMCGYQAVGSAPFMRGGPVRDPETVATAIRIGDPQSWDLAWAVQRESGGWFDECLDAEILHTQRHLAELDGIFCEPASAASLCGALRDIRAGKIAQGSTVVCTLTGNGLKDPDIIVKDGLKGVVQVEAERGAVEKALLDRLGR
ncbi:MAG: threonine synthase [Hydrocarboniphaga sp.]|uniref:threonine synthase n=1 Tax=Hydrocarboniphaga sp. TaxID=2033016 RepID=UPI002639C836|nr:threonine synthase [Hydrocarboniphaga sp.]MDB5971856.1 threonine synthase [Hydrocarboniphaga sp.]